MLNNAFEENDDDNAFKILRKIHGWMFCKKTNKYLHNELKRKLPDFLVMPRLPLLGVFSRVLPSAGTSMPCFFSIFRSLLSADSVILHSTAHWERRFRKDDVFSSKSLSSSSSTINSVSSSTRSHFASSSAVLLLPLRLIIDSTGCWGETEVAGNGWYKSCSSVMSSLSELLELTFLSWKAFSPFFNSLRKVCCRLLAALINDGWSYSSGV